MVELHIRYYILVFILVPLIVYTTVGLLLFSIDNEKHNPDTNPNPNSHPKETNHEESSS